MTIQHQLFNTFDSAYKERAPWDIDHPQQAIRDLVQAGQIEGTILDAGCGTGLLTLALLRAIRFPVSLTALDLSSTSVAAARKSLYYSPGRKRDVTFTQGNLLCRRV